MLTRLSLEAEANTVGLCGDHDKCKTSSVCPSKTCTGESSFRRSRRWIVYGGRLAKGFARENYAYLVGTPSEYQVGEVDIGCEGNCEDFAVMSL